MDPKTLAADIKRIVDSSLTAMYHCSNSVTRSDLTQICNQTHADIMNTIAAYARGVITESENRYQPNF